MFNFGKYDQRIVIYAPAETKTSTGAISVSFEVVKTIWAEIVPTGGNESIQADEKVASRTIKLRIRKNALTTINEKYQFEWRGERYEIITIDPFGMRLNDVLEIVAVSKDNV